MPLPRMLLCSTEFPPGPGGIGTHAWQLAKNLSDLAWEVRVVSCQDYSTDAEIKDWNRRQPFDVVRLWSGLSPARALYTRCRTIRDQIHAFAPDVIVASGLRSLWLAAMVNRRHIPLVAVGHGSEFTVKPTWQRWLTRKALRRAARVVCVSEFTRELAIQLGASSEATPVILNGADPAEYFQIPAAESWQRRRQLGEHVDHVLLTVGHVSERKAQDIVIRALPRILGEFPNTHYVIAGMPTRKPELTELADSLQVGGNVHFLGRLPLDALRGWFNACDLFVLTSRNTATGDCEGFGIVAVEAALCGKASVVTRDSGLAEAVLDGVTGFTVPQEDPAATAEAICKLLGDDGLRKQTAAAALTRATDELTWQRRISDYDVLLREVIGRPNSDASRSPAMRETAGV